MEVNAASLLRMKSGIACLLSTMVAALAIACPLLAEASLQITSPRGGTVVNPGQTITVNVSTSGDTFTGVFIVSPAKNGLDPLLTAPPFQFSITIPANTSPGIYKLSAMGTTATSGLLSSDPVSIDVERPDSPQNIRVEPSSLTLSVGDNEGLAVWGTYGNDNYVDLTKSKMTTFESGAPRLASVTNDGLVTGVGGGSTKIIIKHKGLKISVDVVVTRRDESAPKR